jgi:hypothetical protein
LIPLVKPTAASRQNQVAKPVANKSASPTPSSSKTGTPVKSHTLLHEHETLTDDCTQTPFGAVAVDPVEVSSALSKLDKDKAEEVIRSFVDSMIAELDQTVDESEQSEVTAIESVAKPEQCNTEQLNALMESPSKQQTFVINEQASVDLKLIAQQCLDDIIVNALNMADRQQQATEQPSEQNQQSILFDEAEQLGKSLLQGDADALVRSLKTNANFWSGNQSFLLDYLLTAQRLKFHENVFAAFEKARSKAPFKQMIPMMLRYAVNVIINTVCVLYFCRHS